MKSLIAVITFALIGGIVATINRLYFYAKNPELITRTTDNKIHWKWCIFNNTARILVSMGSAIFVGLTLVPKTLEETTVYAIVGVSAVIGEKIWDFIMDKGLSFLIDLTDFLKTKKTKR